uniref:NACHT domain-containing protein n=1 Tax=Neogobius melanostomus TaxID=47308 RepID=A0A8C6TN10_9GOBI
MLNPKKETSMKRKMENNEGIHSPKKRLGSCSEQSDGSLEPSNLATASTASKLDFIDFRADPRRLQKTVASTDPSGMSLASDSSMFTPISFHHEPTGPRELFCCICEEKFDDPPVSFTCGHVACTPCVIQGTEQETDQFYCTVCGTNKRMSPDQAPNILIRDRQILDTIQSHKKEMYDMFSMTSEGYGDERSPLNHIYTSLSIHFGKREIVEQPYLRQMIQRKNSDEKEVSGFFESSPAKFSRTILTNGTAGIGKSFSVQKFIVDWAEGISNKDVHFILNLSFRELNLINEDMSLLKLLKMFHPAALSELKPQDLDFTKVILILDGFDESRFLLNFSDKQKVSSVQETASVPSLLINLIQGNLLPEAQLWITSRPAASYQIPGEFIHKVTEIQGFNDQQKEEYFTKRFRNKPDVAKMVISHIQSSPTMDMLCQIPIFCWMSSVLLEEVFGGEEQTEAPQTLTEMMGAFLFVQTKRSSKKYDKNPERERSKLLKAKRDFLLKLGKLAFIHLLRNSLIFYEEDLKQCGLDPKEVTVNSGFFNSVLKEDQLFLQQKVYYFVHLTIQEFFAALYVYDCFTNNTDWAPELSDFLGLENSEPSSRPSVLDLLKTTVTKVLERNSRHLYFLQRFLLGLVVESNQKCLRGLLVPVKSGQETVGKMLGHLKAIRRKTVSPDACINLFQSMVEMGDVKISEELQEYLKNEDRARIALTPLHCSALAFTIQVSKSVFEELDLKSYNTSEEGRRRLIPAVRSSRKANLSDCKVSEALLKPLALALSFPHSSLRDLDLTNSDLGDSGVELLCEGLKSPVCKLKILKYPTTQAIISTFSHNLHVQFSSCL